MTARTRPTEVTEHAVDRYIQRWRPDIQRALDQLRAEARRDLESLAARAEFTGETDSEARALWRCCVPELLDRHLVFSGGEPPILCEQAGKFSTVLPKGSKAPNRRPNK
jgi:hypothetical protein